MTKDSMILSSLRVLICFACMAGLGVGHGFAKDLIFPKMPAAWKVNVKPAKEKKEDVPEMDDAAFHGQTSEPEWVLSSIEVLISEELSSSKLKFSNGKTSEIWWLKDPEMMLAENPRNNEIEIDTFPVNSGLLMPGESLFRWVGAKSYKGQRKYRGRLCNYYKDSLIAPGQEPGFILKQQEEQGTGKVQPRATAEREAWVDAETGLPVALNDSVNLYEFEFSPPPENVTLPPKFQAAVREALAKQPKPEYLGRQRSWKKKE